MKTIDVLIDELGISLGELAVRCQLPQERLAAIVDGRWLPNPQERQRIAAALAVDVSAVSWGHTMSPRNVRYHRYGLKEDFGN